MEERRLNFEAPFLSMRRISTIEEFYSESDENNNENPREAASSCLKTDCSIVRPFCLSDGSFDPLTGAASVPFVWEQFPGRPKDVIGSENLKENLKTELEQEEEQDDDDDDAVDMVSLNNSFSVNCSISGISEFEKNVCEEEEEEDESRKFREGRITEYRDLMMSRFIPAAKAMALEHQSQSQWQSQWQSQQQNQISSCFEQRQQQMRLMINRQAAVLAVLSRCEDMSNDEDRETNDDDDDHRHHHHEDYHDYDKKACGLLPKLCVKNSLNVLNPVPVHRIEKCRQNLGKMKSGKISRDSVHKQKQDFRSQSSLSFCGSSNRVMKDFSSNRQLITPSRRIPDFISPYGYESNFSPLSEAGFVGDPEKADNFRVKGLHPRRRREISSLFNSSLSEKRRVSASSMNSPGTGRMPSTDHKTRSYYRIQDMKLLAEEVAERRRINVLRSCRSEQRSLVAVSFSPPPLPKSPTESWLWRTLSSVTTARIDSWKLRQKTKTLESMKWETIVKTACIYRDDNRYSEGLIVHRGYHNQKFK